MRQDVYLEFSSPRISASLSVLRRVVDLFKKRPDAYRIVGGWGTCLLCKEHSLVGPHVGSFDIDVLLIPQAFSRQIVYETLGRDLRGAGFMRDNSNPARWYLLGVNGIEDVRLDLLAPGSSPARDECETIQDVQAWKAYGTEFMGITFRRAALPAGMAWGLGAVGTQDVTLPSGASLLVAKAITLHDRRGLTEEYKPYKDAYDVYYLISSYADGPAALVEEMRSLADQPCKRIALDSLQVNFASAAAPGSLMASNFLRDLFGDRNRMAQEISSQVIRFMELVNEP